MLAATERAKIVIAARLWTTKSSLRCIIALAQSCLVH
jgi:hypothetical protein